MAQKIVNVQLQQRFNDTCVKHLRKLPLRPCQEYKSCPFGINAANLRNCGFYAIHKNSDKDGHMFEIPQEQLAIMFEIPEAEVNQILGEAGRKIQQKLTEDDLPS